MAILFVLRDAAREIYRRLMDAVDPALVDEVEQALRATDGVLDLGAVRVRWIGHSLRAECNIVVDSGLTVVEGHRIAGFPHDLRHEERHRTLRTGHRIGRAGFGLDAQHLFGHG